MRDITTMTLLHEAKVESRRDAVKPKRRVTLKTREEFYYVGGRLVEYIDHAHFIPMQEGGR